MNLVLLNQKQLDLCRREGEDRRFYSELISRYGRRNSHRYTPEQALAVDILGATGEYVVSLWTGLPWTARGEVGSPHGNADVGTDVQVRTTGKETNRLILFDEDNSRHRFVQVCKARTDLFIIQGWMYGHEGKQERYRSQIPQIFGYLPPDAALRVMETFRCPNQSKIVQYQPDPEEEDDFL